MPKSLLGVQIAPNGKYVKMALLELVNPKPDWFSALEAALSRPPGTPERRKGEDPWNPPEKVERPRRISDDLAWLRQAIDDPSDHGLKSVDDTAAVAVWEPEGDPLSRLGRLEQRGILHAAGFLLHQPEGEPLLN